MELVDGVLVERIMKRDGSTFDHQTLEAIRLMAVERVREGEPASKVIESFGFNRTSIYRWLQSALQPGMGIKALRSTLAEGASAPGTIGKDLTIACGDGAVRLTLVQREGKGAMDVATYLRGAGTLPPKAG